MTTPTRLMTAEEFSDRDEREDGCKEELVGGVIESAPPPGDTLGEIQINVAGILREFVRANRLGKVLGESGYRLKRDPDQVRGPDVSFISGARRAGLQRVGAYLDGAPELAVEIVSPTDRADKVEAKVRAYLEAGALRVWVLYPETRSLTVHRADGNSHTFAGDEIVASGDAGFAVDGFEAPVSAFFEDID